MRGKPTARQIDVLGVLEGGDYTATEVGEYHLPIGASSARASLTSLERRGLATRIYTGYGDRGIKYSITAAGAAILDEEAQR